MTSKTQQSENFMRTNMADIYPHIEAAINDITNTALQYKDLKVGFDTFFYNDGTAKKLANLRGTIPVYYRDNFYNIPVVLWIQPQHPVQAPICFVEPTSNMERNKNKSVDSTGRVQTNYLKNWHAMSHTLLGCVQAMCTAFSQEPPVYAKPPHVQAGHSTTFPPIHYLSTPVDASKTQLASGSVSATQQYPAGFVQPASFLPYPAYPIGQPQPNKPQPTPVPIGQQKNLVRDDKMRLVSLRSALNDKLKQRARAVYTRGLMDLKASRRMRLELEDSREHVARLEKMLHDEIAHMDSTLQLLSSKNKEVCEEVKVATKRREELKPDDYVTTTAPVYRQVIESFAEQLAINDLIFEFSRGLERKCVDLDVFLKHARSLHREQFMLRLIIEKARLTAKLPAPKC